MSDFPDFIKGKIVKWLGDNPKGRGTDTEARAMFELLAGHDMTFESDKGVMIQGKVICPLTHFICVREAANRAFAREKKRDT